VIRRSLFTLAGAEYDVVAGRRVGDRRSGGGSSTERAEFPIGGTPVVGVRHIAIAGALSVTGVVAAISAAFALRMAAQVPMFWAIVLGIGWGVVVLRLDRLLVITMTRQPGWWRSVLFALPQLAAVFLLGMVISTPLVLRVFQPQINTEIAVELQQKYASAEQRIADNPRYKAIPALKQQIDAESKAAQVDPNAVDSDPAVVAAQDRLTQAERLRDQAQQDYLCESDGTCGTGRAGDGPQARTAKQAVDQAQAEVDAAQANLNSERRQVSDALRAQAAVRVKTLQHDYDERQADRAEDQKRLDASARQYGKGLLIRLQALSAVGREHPELGRLQVLLSLLFLAIGMLPALVKLLQPSRKPALDEQSNEQQGQIGRTPSR
jgi:hypothetical protein